MSQGVLFDSRFLDTIAGKAILHNAKIAIVELVANAWDAGATKVSITWPDSESGIHFSIQDNGLGMTEKEFTKRWRTLAYNRIKEQGEFAEFPSGIELSKRPVFGRNGVGRFAGFCFGEEYFVSTSKDGKEVTFKVRKEVTKPFSIEKINEVDSNTFGTKIYVENSINRRLSDGDARSEIGMRFLVDPKFEVTVNSKKVSFSDIPTQNVLVKEIIVESFGTVTIRIIDTKEADKTTHQHGIAWHVNRRLVGECSWKGTEHEQLILDGRRSEAKRYTFIIEADCLVNSVLKDWTGFKENNDVFSAVNAEVQKVIKNHILGLTKERRDNTFEEVRKANKENVTKMSPLKRERWGIFVRKVQEDCPSINEKDLIQLAGVLANLELADNRYKLISKLHELDPSQLDNLHDVLDDWSIDMAKVVLDELQTRIKLLDELHEKVIDENTDELHELQPIFHRGLWIFGPEYETIEFTSNLGMTNVISKLFKSDVKGSKNRPDFAVLPDSTAGFYYYPTYDDDDGGENGVDRLVIVELKKPGINISTDEKGQCWKYVRELHAKGLLQEGSKVTCFVLGSQVDPIERSPRLELNDTVKIIPLTYTTVIDRAKSRLLKLYDKVKSAPFLDKDELDEFLDNGDSGQMAMTLSE